jgi:hypothetical protein
MRERRSVILLLEHKSVGEEQFGRADSDRLPPVTVYVVVDVVALAQSRHRSLDCGLSNWKRLLDGSYR